MTRSAEGDGLAEVNRLVEGRKPSDVVVDRLIEARNKKGWSQRDLAQAMKEAGWTIDRTTIAKIESRGDRALNLKLNELIAFAIVLGVSPVFLMVPGTNDVRVDVTPKFSFKTQDFHWWVSGKIYQRPLPARLRGETESEHAARLRVRADWRFFEYMRPLQQDEESEAIEAASTTGKKPTRSRKR